MQTMQDEPLPMPSNSDHTATILHVMHEHGVSQQMLAERSGLSPGTISRICSGQFGVSASVTQALWQLTHDDRVVQLALGVAEPVIIACKPDKATAFAVDRASCMIAMSNAMAQIADSEERPDKQPVCARTIETAVGYMVGYYARIMRGETIPLRFRPARTVPPNLSA